jgi:hypothetical protein
VAGLSLADLTAGTRQTIGRYFSVVSMVPSLLFVIYIFLLISSGAWRHSPSWASAVESLVHIGIGGALALIVLATAVGIAIHPLQFSMVQVLEGYWGTSVPARKARAARIRRYRQRVMALADKEPDDDEASRLLDLYPHDPERIMPTRLGNVLRRYESLAGRQYELNALVVLPHMALAAQPEDVRYLDDQRTQLDLAVRMCFTAMLATVVSAAILWRDDQWFLLAVIPGGVAYLSYLGAVVSAREYGVAMEVLIDMNRFAFYERLHLPMPSNVTGERDTNKQLMRLLEAHSVHVFIRYEAPGAQGPTRRSNSNAP